MKPREHARDTLFSGRHPLKLGVFSANVSRGGTMTTAPDALTLDWQQNLAIHRAADAMGFELVIPVSRWRSFGGTSDFNAESFETYTWAAGVGQATDRIACVATSHVTTVHPLLAAKQGATIDHISNGRFALNIVCGWFQEELEMFGGELMPHDERYEYATEWLDLVKRFWTSDHEFDFTGRYFQIKRGVTRPSPLQRPFPPLINAGGSPRGQRFAAQHCDIAFVTVDQDDLGAAAAHVQAYRDMARREFQRELKVWAIAYVVQGNTQREAEEYLHHYAVTLGDDAAVANCLRTLGVQSQMFSTEQYARLKFHLKAGYFGYPLIGTPERIVDGARALSKIGIDGLALVWCDYYDGLARWRDGVMPLLAQAGLRAS
jgi:dimethylsulfone monooxygenase